MSSTEAEVSRDALRELFIEQLLPAASEGGKPRAFFPLGGDASTKSYYVSRPKSKMSRDDFLIRTSSGGDDPIVALGEMWKKQGFDKLAALAPKLQQVAAALRQIEKPADDVSPFIYVMF